jgi:hypothetical protein
MPTGKGSEVSVKHTPGPWTLEKNPPHTGDPDPELPPYWFIEKYDRNSEGFHIAAFLKDADALLIASAPELLKACKAAVEHLEEELRNPRYSHLHPVGECPVLDLIRAAIAKAEGAQ